MAIYLQVGRNYVHLLYEFQQMCFFTSDLQTIADPTLIYTGQQILDNGYVLSILLQPNITILQLSTPSLPFSN